MELSESSRTYLENYFLLEQTRSEANRFLFSIASGVAAHLEQRFEGWGDGLFEPVQPWVLSEGGEAGVLLRVMEESSTPQSMWDWRYYVRYHDAIGARDLTDPTHCFVYGRTPKAKTAQVREVAKAAAALGVSDPYRTEELPLLNASVEVVIENITDVLMDFCDTYAKVIKVMASNPDR